MSGLGRYRRLVLRRTAKEIALRAGVSEGRILQVESALPQYRKYWKRYADAYGLDLEQFARIAGEGVMEGGNREVEAKEEDEDRQSVSHFGGIPRDGVARAAGEGGAACSLPAGVPQ